MLRRRPIMRVAATTAVVAGTAAAVGGGVSRRQARRAGPQEAPAPEAAPASAPAEDVYAQLSQLGALHEQGVLTDEEFSAQKAKLLG